MKTDVAVLFAVFYSPIETVSLHKLKLNSMAFSPQANYTDRATATCRRN
jgi:hypothetical protein